MSVIPPQDRLINRVPYAMRQSIVASGEFQQLCSEFVRKHVQQSVNSLIDRLQNAQGFEDDMEELSPGPDYVEACTQNDVCLVEGHDSSWFHFQWKEPVGYPLDAETGKCVIDFDRFALDNGLQLQDWLWDKEQEEAVHKANVNDDNRAYVVDGPVLPRIAKAQFGDANEMIDLLARAAKQVGKEALAKDLNTPGRYEKLFTKYLQNDHSSWPTDTFGSESEAAEDACREYDIDGDDYTPEVYEYWLVDGDMAYWLEKQGEVVANNFLDNLTVWGRCTTGQAISMDGVISNIVRELYSDEVDALVKAKYPNLGSTNERLAGVNIDVLKAIEQERLKQVSFSYDNRWQKNEKQIHYVVTDAESPDKAWVLVTHRAAAGYKHESASPEDSRPLSDITANLMAGNTLIGEVSIAAPDQTSIDELADKLSDYHRINRDSPLHVVPDNLESRLAAISQAYAKAHGNDGPSLG